MSQVTQKEARGAAHAAPAAAAAAAAAIVAPLPPATVRPRGGVEPLPLPRTPRRRAQHPGGPRSRRACALCTICSLSALTSATQAQAAAGGAHSASHRTSSSVRAGAQAPASTSRQLRRGQIPGERRRRRPGLPGDTAAASLRTKSARVLPALASSGRTSTSSARVSTGPARC